MQDPSRPEEAVVAAAPAARAPPPFCFGVLDYIMHFLLVSEAHRLRLVCSQWKAWIDPILSRGPFDMLVASMSPEDELQLARRQSEADLLLCSYLREAFICGDVPEVEARLLKRPFNMPLIGRRKIAGGFHGTFVCFSPAVMAMEGVNRLMTVANQQGDRKASFLVLPIRLGFYSNADTPGFDPSSYLLEVSRQWGDVTDDQYEAAAKKVEFANKWFSQVTGMLRMLKRHGWLHPQLPLVAYAMWNLHRGVRWSTVTKLLRFLTDELGCGIDTPKVSTGATALHVVCGYENPKSICVRAIHMLRRRGASWRSQTTVADNGFPLGVTPLEVLKFRRANPEGVTARVTMEELDALIAEAERGETYTHEADEESDTEPVAADEPTPATARAARPVAAALDAARARRRARMAEAAVATAAARSMVAPEAGRSTTSASSSSTSSSSSSSRSSSSGSSNASEDQYDQEMDRVD